MKSKCETVMGALLAVSQGSREEAKLIRLNIVEQKDKAPVAPGKGITFDTGYSLKSPDSMVAKYDMSVLLPSLAPSRQQQISNYPSMW